MKRAECRTCKWHYLGPEEEGSQDFCDRYKVHFTPPEKGHADFCNLEDL